MLAFAFFVVLFAICPMAWFYGRRWRKRDPESHERFRQRSYPYLSFLLALTIGMQGITNDKAANSLVSLASAAFFATSFLYSLKRPLADEHRFSMMQLLLFTTLLALGLGVRAVVQAD